MRNVAKTTTLENKFPLLAVENNCILSKDADITACFEVRLPELFTVASAEYEAIHSAWHKAIKTLPDFTVIHKQDWYIKENYAPDLAIEDQSFLAKSYQRHFNERPFLNHYCYLFLTKTTKERMRMQSNFSSLCKGSLIPKEIRDKEAIHLFMETVAQFERIVNDSGFVSLRRLTEEDIIGIDGKQGLLEQYLTLSREPGTPMQDIALGTEEVRIGNKRLSLHTLSDTDDLPGTVSADTRFEKLSTDRSDCRLSFAAPVGLLLSCNHIYNQYLFLDNSEANLQKFEKSARNMHSLARYSRANQINKEWIEKYLNEAHSFGLSSVRAHFNIMAWSEDPAELKQLKNDCGSALALMECKPRHNTTDVATLYWAGMPGNAGDFPAEESFYTFIEPALCFFTEETNYHNSPSPFGIKMADRLTGKPIHLDISDLPMKRGIITNRNKFILGPSGSGKSFFTNHMVRQYYEQGAHVLLVDTGNSYQGLCELIKGKTKGEDGVYFTYTEDNPIAFNPFYTDDGVFDIEKRESVKTLILTLWKRDDEPPTRSEEVALSNAVSGYIERIKSDDVYPSFNGFYEYVKGDYRNIRLRKKAKFNKVENNKTIRYTDYAETGNIVGVQVKGVSSIPATGSNSYYINLADKTKFGVNFSNKANLDKQKEIWKNFIGPVILIFVDLETRNCWWADLNDEESYFGSEYYLTVEKKNEFTIEAFKEISKLGRELFATNRLIDIDTKNYEFYDLSLTNFKKSAKDFYSNLSDEESHLYPTINPKLGEIKYSLSGWKHITRLNRRKMRIFNSLLLLGVSKIICEKVERYTSVKRGVVRESKRYIKKVEFVTLRANINFNFRQSTIVQVVLRRVKTFDKVNPTIIIPVETFFHSIYEPYRKE